MHSPTRGYRLQEIAGDRSTISTQAKHLTDLGEQMKQTAAHLTEIANSCVHRSMGTDQLAESAAEIDSDLKSAGVRYNLTGKAMSAYATALRENQPWINNNVDDIRNAENTYRTRQQALADARSAQTGLDNRPFWQDDPTQQERTAAATAVSDAETNLAAITTRRNELWETYESKFGAWSTAYDTAVDGVQHGIDEADNNDGFWEALGNFLDVLGYVVAALAIVALFISGPIGLLIMAIVVVGSIVLLAGKIAQFAAGKTDLLDLGIAIIGVLTLGAGGAIARIALKGAPTLRAMVSSTRAIARPAIRASRSQPRLLNPFTWHRGITNRVVARGQARSGAPMPGWVTNGGRSIRYGSSNVARQSHFLSTAGQNLGHYPAVSQHLATLAKAALPGRGAQVAFSINWGIGTVASGVGVVRTALNDMR